MISGDAIIVDESLSLATALGFFIASVTLRVVSSLLSFEDVIQSCARMGRNSKQCLVDYEANMARCASNQFPPVIEENDISDICSGAIRRNITAV
ncbi:hypothetical protein BDR04DRAFT_1109932 [Suillus decipiens]|nr:hypothetical protein BDR04DRAFT_1109932 [Suillus decipiens]